MIEMCKYCLLFAYRVFQIACDKFNQINIRKLRIPPVVHILKKKVFL